MTTIIILALLAWLIVGYILIPLMKVFGIIILLSGVGLSFLAIMFLLGSPGWAVAFLLFVLMAGKKSKRTSFI